MAGRSEVILGVDPGSIRTGFGLIQCSDIGIRHLSHGTIVLDKRKALADRLRDLAIDLHTVVDRYQPTQAVVEDVFYHKNARAALTLGQARGVVLGILGLKGISVQGLTPTEIKSLVTGAGRAKKFQVASLVALELQIAVPASPDSSDALAIALAQALKNNGQHKKLAQA